jgi:hypothetical protein
LIHCYIRTRQAAYQTYSLCRKIEQWGNHNNYTVLEFN